MIKRGTPFYEDSGRKERLEQMTLEMYRDLLNNPDMSVQEMRETFRRKQDNRDSTIEVTFLKSTKNK